MSNQYPLPTDRETTWSKWLAKHMGGISEYVLKDKSRVDILTSTLAIEVDWVKKWPQSIGQAVFYGTMTDRQPAILLLLRDKPTEYKYIQRAKMTADKLNIAVFTWRTNG